ncbi:MAG: HEAT repeat domain-containing protein [Planctomycetes bacterium]|nr:HEAT repeat domain-containing protein [Planctomycetota bacterium]
MNSSPFDRNGTHLDGALLEALAVGTARAEERAHAQEHLNACARCRDEIDAMRAENAGFDGFFRAEEAGMLQRAEAGNPASPRRVVYLALGAIAAAAVVIAATMMLSNLNAPVLKSRSSVAEENPGPKPPPAPQPVPPPNVPDPVTVPQPAPVHVEAPNAVEAATYQGKTAEEWVSILKAGKDEETKEKARHALARIGAEALPLLLKMMREGTPAEKQDAGIVLAALEDKNSVPEIIKLLADPGWEVRLQAVVMLSKYVPDDDRAVQALQGALKDRDKAVAEAALNEELVRENSRRADELAKVKGVLLKQQQMVQVARDNEVKARNEKSEALKLDPASKEAQVAQEQVLLAREDAQRQADQISKMLAESQDLIKQQKYDAAMMSLQRILTTSPANAQAQRLLKMLKDLIARDNDAAVKHHLNAGEADLPGTEQRAPKVTPAKVPAPVAEPTPNKTAPAGENDRF